MKFIKLVGCIILILMFSGSINAQLPTTISYSGMVSDSVTSTPLSGSHSIGFTLYDASNNTLWTDAYTVNVTDGLFSVELGSGNTSLPDNIFTRELWLGIQVGADPEMSPRHYLTSVPYAFTSSSVMDGGVSLDALGTPAKSYLNPQVKDASGNSLGALLSVQLPETWQIITSKGFITDVYLSGNVQQITDTSIYYESIDCSGQGYIILRGLLGTIFEAQEGNYYYALQGSSSVANITLDSWLVSGTCLANHSVPTEVYPAYPNNPAVTGFEASYPIPRPLSFDIH